MPPLDIHTPAVVHHMGALDPRTGPPNSLETVRASLAVEPTFIEVDVTALARDDYLLVHDPVLESETSGQGEVAACSPEQARALFIKHQGQVTASRVPLLSDIVTLLLETPNSTRLQLDFKNVYPMMEDEPLRRLVRLIEPLGTRVLVSTGADWHLRKLRKLAPWLRLGFDIMFYIGWGPEGERRDPRELPRQRGAYGYYDDHPLAQERGMPTVDYLRDRAESLVGLVPDVSVFYLDYRLIARSLTDGFNWAEVCHANGIKLDAWTMDVTKPPAVEQAPRLLQAGVDLFTTNTPRALAELLGITQLRPSR